MSALRLPALVGILAFVLMGCAPQTSPATALPATSIPATQSLAPTAAASPTSPPPAASSTPSITATIAAITPPAAPALPDPASAHWVQVLAGLVMPTDIRAAMDGSGRLFIVEKPGRILILKDGKRLDAPFLDIRDRVGSGGSEQGLLGLAFHPKYAQNGFFYVNYTDKSGNTHIARFSASGDTADPSSEKQLLFVQQPFPNHNGGSLAFGPDGFLYSGLGDGGSAGDPYGNAQSGNSMLGKILRLDVNNGDPYAIPADNPFATSGEVYREVWAYGLRNPWRFSFDSQTGDLWIGDVGQNQWEEIDFVPAGSAGGLNFGWNQMEGFHPYNGSDQPGFTAPVAEYQHGPECSVTGGYVYRGQALPGWRGVYLFGDYCSGALWGLPSPPAGAQAGLLYQTGFRISTFGVDETGELYVADYGSGAIYRLEPAP